MKMCHDMNIPPSIGVMEEKEGLKCTEPAASQWKMIPNLSARYLKERKLTAVSPNLIIVLKKCI